MSFWNAPSRWWQRRQKSLAVWTWRRAHLGAGAQLARTAQVYGWEHVRIGSHTLICDDCLLNALNVTGTTPQIVIGDHCLLGRRNFLNAGTELVFADYCLTGPDCHFLGCDHAHDSPFVPYLAAGNEPGGRIALGPNVWLGARVTVLKNTHIGHGSIIGAASVVTRDVPPFAVAVGSPARVIKRFCPRRDTWVAAADFTEEDAAALPGEAAYLQHLRAAHPFVRMPDRALGRECGDC